MITILFIIEEIARLRAQEMKVKIDRLAPYELDPEAFLRSRVQLDEAARLAPILGSNDHLGSIMPNEIGDKSRPIFAKRGWSLGARSSGPLDKIPLGLPWNGRRDGSSKRHSVKRSDLELSWARKIERALDDHDLDLTLIDLTNSVLEAA